MTKLPPDRIRCEGYIRLQQFCVRRYKCARYIQRATGDKKLDHMCGTAFNEFRDYIIECDPSDRDNQEQRSESDD